MPTNPSCATKVTQVRAIRLFSHNFHMFFSYYLSSVLSREISIIESSLPYFIFPFDALSRIYYTLKLCIFFNFLLIQPTSSSSRIIIIIILKRKQGEEGGNWQGYKVHISYIMSLHQHACIRTHPKYAYIRT